MSEVSDYAKIRIQELVMQVQKKDARIQRLREALSKVVDTWDVSNPERVVPRWHDGELAPNDSLAAGSIMNCFYVLTEDETVNE